MLISVSFRDRIDRERRNAAAGGTSERLQLVDGEHHAPVALDVRKLDWVSRRRPSGVNPPELSSNRKA
jgi:hypothetical protein